MMDIWYYVDNARNRQGPVNAAAVAAAFQAGQVNDDSLVWREGLAQWAPLRQFRDELGMGPAIAPAAAPPAAAPPPASPAAGDKKKNGCLVPALILAGVGAVMVPVLAIVAAIALPAYQDYLIRSKLTSALAEGRSVLTAVEEHFQTTGRCPTSFEEVGVPRPDLAGQLSVELVSLGEGRCVIEIAVEGMHSSPELVDRRIYLSREEDGRYACSTDLDQSKYVPASCH